MSTGKIFLVVIGIILGVVFIFLVGLYVILSPLEKTDNKIFRGEIIFQEINKTLYVETAYWGLAGNHNEIIISETSFDIKEVPDKKRDYIFYTSEIYYKKESNNKLVIYAPKSLTSTPVTGFSDVTIILKDLRTSDEIKDYKKNYQKYDLEKISIYE